MYRKAVCNHNFVCMLIDQCSSYVNKISNLFELVSPICFCFKDDLLYVLYEGYILPIVLVYYCFTHMLGLPKRNGDNHAGEIASMSLELLAILKNYKIIHRPGEKLRLRIGKNLYSHKNV